MTREEFDEMPVIMSFFPLRFATGRQCWTNFVVSCNDCGWKVPEDQTRGFVEREVTGGYRTTSTSYSVVAHALCPACNKLTTAVYLLHEDMTCTGISPATGEKACWQMRKLTLWEKIVDFTKNLWGS